MTAKKILTTGLAIVLLVFLGIMSIVTPMIIVNWAKVDAPHTEYRWAEIEKAESSAGVLFRDTEGEQWYYEAEGLDPNGFYVLYIDTNGSKTLEDDEILKIFQER